MKPIAKFIVILVALVALLAATRYVVSLNQDGGSAPAQFSH